MTEGKTRGGAEGEVNLLSLHHFPQPPWADQSWGKKLAAWLESTFKTLGSPEGVKLVSLQTRPWSAVYQIAAADLVFILKTSAPQLRHEAWATAWLADQFPALVPRVVACSLEDGWLLLPSYADRMRESLTVDQRLQAWMGLLPRYAEMQRTLVRRKAEMLQGRIPDRNTLALSGLCESLLDMMESGVRPELGTIDESAMGGLRRELPRLHSICSELADGGLGDSLNHGDLHDGNVFLDEGSFRILDWGDCSLSHPFFSLRTTFVSIENSLGSATSQDELALLRDAYLEPWSEGRSRSELLETLGLARRIWDLASALSWACALETAGGQDDFAHAVPSLLGELHQSLLGNPLGSVEG